MPDDPDEIYVEVRRRKDRARELAVPELIWDLFENVRYFPSYSRNEPVGYQKFVSSFVTAIQESRKIISRLSMTDLAIRFPGVRKE
jgi:hypothetical protein